jgi:hypothetical protein
MSWNSLLVLVLIYRPRASATMRQSKRTFPANFRAVSGGAKVMAMTPICGLRRAS